MERLRLSISLLLLLIYNVGYAQPIYSIKTQIAAGAYHKSAKPLPLLLVSNNNGQSWSFVATISGQPCETYTGTISEASCNDTVCSAVGSGFNQTPLLVSYDKGLSWALVKNILGFPASNAEIISSVSCTNKTCVAVGAYFNPANGTNLPLLIKSDGGGLSWTFIQNILDLPNDLKSAELNSISCVGSLCSAVGNYQTKSNSPQLLLLISNDSGETWSFIKNSAVLSPNFNMSELIVNCAGDTCIVAGHYNEITQLPLLLVSNDKGHTWAMIKRLVGRTSEMSDGQFHSVTCTGKVCIGSGVYHENDTYLPLLVQSKDSGKTWSIVHNILNLPANMQAAELSSASCSENICVASGYYNSDNTEFPYLPLLLVSSNNGESWIFIDKISAFPAKSASFHAASCSENTCIAAGEYYHVADLDLPPPLVVSNDKGQSWSFVDVIPGFPNGLTSAEVVALVAGSESKP